MPRMLPVLLVAWILAQAAGLLACTAYTAEAAFPRPDQFEPDQGCSVIYATDGELMLGGNNEDYFNPLTKIWFIPSEDGSFGRVYFGFDDYFAQGGMNDQGLFFDGLGLDTTLPASKEGKQEYAGNLVDKAMTECATVECVVGLFEQYHTHDAWHWQFFFGDATGESAIIEPQTAIRQRGGYQVVTNFYQSTTPPEERTCWRYQKAVEWLENMEALSVASMRDVLDAVHMDGSVQTLYSNVYDLKNKIVYLYFFHNYDDVVVLDLEEELVQGYHAYDLPSLFLPNRAAEVWSRPKLRRYNELIDSRLTSDLAPEIFQAYAGAYELPDGWGPPDQSMTVIAGEWSLLLRFPDYRQHELFPESATDFFHVAFQRSDYAIAYEARFSLDENQRVEHLELVFGPESILMNRLGPESIVPAVAAPKPAVTAVLTSTATPTHTAKPTVTLTLTAMSRPTTTVQPTATLAPTTAPTSVATSVEMARAAPAATVIEVVTIPTEPDEGVDSPWTWLIVPLIVVGAVVGWMTLRQRQ